MKIIIFLVSILIIYWANARTDVDVSAGQQAYVQCVGCHSPDYHRTGPKHCGLLGRQAGTALGFKFTPSMKDSGIIWNDKNLDMFLTNPLKMIPGTSMGFRGVQSKVIRAQLIAYLATLNKENILCK